MQRPLIYYAACSLDGFIARADGSVDWLYGEGDYGFDDFYAGIDTVVMGRLTYEQALSFGPYPYEGREGIVYSRRRAGERDAHVLFTDEAPRALLARLRARPGRGIWLVGGGELAGAFLTEDLVDEIDLFVHPLVLGQGVPLFAVGAPSIHFEPTHTQVHPDGLVELRLQRRREAEG